MKKSSQVMVGILLLAFCLSGCQGEISTELPGLPAATLPAPTITQAFIPTIIASQTPVPPLVEIPDNSQLADSGYDIADVRISYPREDMMLVDFKYQLEDGVEQALIWLILPSNCKRSNGRNPMFSAPTSSGEGQFIAKMTLQGECAAPSFDMTIYPFDPVSNGYRMVAYQEQIFIPFAYRRTAPTFQTETVTTGNFAFEPISPWAGRLVFDYWFSSDIPMADEELYFWLFGQEQYGICSFSVNGPMIGAAEGKYTFDIDLTEPNMLGDDGCLENMESLSFPTITVILKDRIMDQPLFEYQPEINLIFTNGD